MKKEHAGKKDAEDELKKVSPDETPKRELPPDDQHTPGEDGEHAGGGLRGA